MHPRPISNGQTEEGEKALRGVSPWLGCSVLQGHRGSAAAMHCHPEVQHRLERNICYLPPSLDGEGTEAPEVKQPASSVSVGWDLASEEPPPPWRLAVLPSPFLLPLLPGGENCHFKMRSGHPLLGRQKALRRRKMAQLMRHPASSPKAVIDHRTKLTLLF